MKPEAFIKVEDQTNQFDLDFMPSASVVETGYRGFKDPSLPIHETLASQGVSLS